MKKKPNDFEGYVWGWIKSDGTRMPSKESVVDRSIVGIWGEFSRKGIKPYYRETFLHEYIPDKEAVTSWTKLPQASLQSMNLQQCLVFAYPENRQFACESLPFKTVKPAESITRQLWECSCAHTFYTDVQRLTVKQWFASVIKKQFPRMKCNMCGENNARRSKKVPKVNNQ